MKTRLVCISLAVFLLLAGCGKKKAPVETTAATQATTAETTAEPTVTEESIPGLEDSIFDDETEPTVEETKSRTESAEPATKATEPSRPVETTEPTETTKPAAPSEPPKSENTVVSEYEKFQNMSASQQQEFMQTFDSLDAFFAWYNNAKAEHKAANPPIDIGDGTIDLGALMG